ncbi:UV-endonuclease UvdE, partial [Rhodotorula sp. JG-1b]
EDAKPVKKKRTRKPKEPEVYVIPAVERKETTFKGRLGYACLNTILRKQKPPVFCSRTCRIDTIEKEDKGMPYLKELGRQNVLDLIKMIEWTAAHHIYFLRVSSELFPFAAHPDYQYSLEYAAEELKLAGETARRLGVRLTSHPAQFCNLCSPRNVVIENAYRDLEYHNEFFTRMGMGKDSVMIIHGGGVHGDKEAALQRFRKHYKELSDGVKARLVLENDEFSYSVDDLLPVCEDLNIPLVFDYHHHSIFPTTEPIEELMPRILALWENKGIRPKFHLSEPRKGAVTPMERRAHADRCQSLPRPLPDDIDLMIEAKDKEQAVFHLYRIYDLAPTIHESLRPPAEEETLQTAGRKSNKPKSPKKGKKGEVVGTDEIQADD